MSESQDQLMQLLETKTETITKRLDRNWLQQLLVGALGLAYLLYPEVAENVVKAMQLKDLPLSYFSIAIPALLFYTFIHFGYILNYFMKMRELYDAQASLYYSRTMKPDDIRLLLEKQTSFEPLYYFSANRQATAWGLVPFLLFSLISASVVVLNHVVAFRIVMRATHGCLHQISITIMVILLTSCYVQFFFTQHTRRMRGATVLLYLLSAAAIIICKCKQLS